MQTFKITKNLEAVCESENTRYGFRHLATLTRNGYEHGDMAKCCYYNRTWESYTFESVLEKLLATAIENKSLTEYETRNFKKTIKNGGKPECQKLKTIAMVASLGAIFATTPKEKNDWKVRVLKAGLEDKELIMPEDWDDLTEEEKQKRLDGAIGALA